MNPPTPPLPPPDAADRSDAPDRPLVDLSAWLPVPKVARALSTLLLIGITAAALRLLGVADFDVQGLAQFLGGGGLAVGVAYMARDDRPAG